MDVLVALLNGEVEAIKEMMESETSSASVVESVFKVA